MATVQTTTSRIDGWKILHKAPTRSRLTLLHECIIMKVRSYTKSNFHQLYDTTCEAILERGVRA
jgi:hypothetical protein